MTRPGTPRQSRVVWLAHIAARSWPLRRGKGLLLKLARRGSKDGFALFRLARGVDMQASLHDYLGCEYFLNGLSKQPCFRLSWDLIRPADLVVDVGANAGYWVLGAAARLDARGSAHAFEPSPEAFDQLSKNVAMNGGRILCHRLALSDRVGKSAFDRSPGNTARAALSPPGSQPCSFEVTTTTLDRFCAANGLDHVDMLKIDVEGAEEAVLRGAEGVLGRSPGPILVLEVGGGLAERYGSSASGVKALLAKFGYTAFRFEQGRLHRVTCFEGHPRTEDLLALKEARARSQPRIAEILARGEA